MKKFIASVSFASALGLTSIASAVTGYVCEVKMYNYSGFGTGGGVFMTFYSGANCTGAYQMGASMCSAASTDVTCSSSTYYTYTSDQLQSFFAQAAESARTGRALNYVTGAACRSGGTNCLQALGFR